MTGTARQLSIRARLALIYTALLVAALAVFGSALYVVLRDQVQANFDSQLLANAEHAAGALAEDVASGNDLSDSGRLVGQFASTGGRVAVLGLDGQTIVDSAPGQPPIAVSAEDLAAATKHDHGIQERELDGDVVRLHVESIPAPGGSAGFVVWSSSTAGTRTMLATVATALTAGGLIVVAIALAVGLFLARRALAPIADMTETARAISLSGDFAARVEAGGQRDELGELALAFNEMLTALEQNHQALQTFLADASHQLRTPLTSVRANLELAQRADIPAAERSAIIADARDEAERMGRLIGDLLSLARAESGARLEFRPIELDALLVDTVRRQAQAARHVRMSVAAVEPALVDGDRDRLRELFGTLLDNAAAYTPAGGNVLVRLTIDETRAIVTVADDGIGLDDAAGERVFERLYRGDQARQMRPSGTGLGLAIARWIAQAHAGSVSIANRRDASTGQVLGAIATVTLPLLRQAGPSTGS